MEKLEDIQPIKRARLNTPTTKQLTAFRLIAQGEKPTAAMVKAGYSPKSARNPLQTLLRSSGIASIITRMEAEMATKGINAHKLASKLAEWLDAKQTVVTKSGDAIENPDYKTQVQAYDRIAKVVGIDQAKPEGQIKRQISLTEFVTGEENDQPPL